jgi:hypothetical protein
MDLAVNGFGSGFSLDDLVEGIAIRTIEGNEGR